MPISILSLDQPPQELERLDPVDEVKELNFDFTIMLQGMGASTLTDFTLSGDAGLVFGDGVTLPPVSGLSAPPAPAIVGGRVVFTVWWDGSAYEEDENKLITCRVTIDGDKSKKAAFYLPLRTAGYDPELPAC